MKQRLKLSSRCFFLVLLFIMLVVLSNFHTLFATHHHMYGVAIVIGLFIIRDAIVDYGRQIRGG